MRRIQRVYLLQKEFLAEVTKMQIVIIDYGSGNLRSVENAIRQSINSNNLYFNVLVTNNLKLIKEADYIVLPGVGAYPDCKDGLIKIEGLIDVLINQVIYNSKPFLGICVGMQLMAEYGFEKKTNKRIWVVKRKYRKNK